MNNPSFKKYCAVVKKYVHMPVDNEELHQLYIDWKTALPYYKQSMTEDVIEVFLERTMQNHGNCLKRNLNPLKLNKT